MLLKNYKFEVTLPECNPSISTVNALAELPNDISEVFPYLNATLKGATYKPNTKTLSFRHNGKSITLFPKKIAVSRLRDEKEAKEVLEWIKKTINETYDKRDSIEPSYKSRDRLTLLDVYKLLPMKNCRECGELTCMAFAAKVVEEKVEIDQCKILFSSDYREKKEKLLEILTEAGYKVSKGIKTSNIEG